MTTANLSHGPTFLQRPLLNLKNAFLVILFINLIFAVFYFFYSGDASSSSRLTFWSRQTDVSAAPIVQTVSDTVKSILEREYNRDDLTNFYSTVENEFSLGLRCQRSSNVAHRPINSSSNLTTRFEKFIERKSKNFLLFFSSSSVDRPTRTKFYSFVINNSQTCEKKSIDLVVIIISKSENYKTRDAIRRTWASGKHLGKYSSIQLKFVFLIDLDEKLRDNIRLENDLFNDIIQVELPQQYSLVTHRVLSLLEWTFRFCRSAKFILKTDDDIFINIFLVLKFIGPLLNPNEERSFRISSMSIYGYKHNRPTVFRHANDPVGVRYVVTEAEFPCGIYPDFLSGFGYLIPKKSRDALVYAALQDSQIPFRISDVYVT